MAVVPSGRAGKIQQVLSYTTGTPWLARARWQGKFTFIKPIRDFSMLNDSSRYQSRENTSAITHGAMISCGHGSLSAPEGQRRTIRLCAFVSRSLLLCTSDDDADQSSAICASSLLGSFMSRSTQSRLLHQWNTRL